MDKKNHILHIRRYLTSRGLIISLGKKEYQINYPIKVWQQFPSVYHSQFADAVSYAFTVHLAFVNFCTDQNLIYHFPPPTVEPLFFKGIIYSLPEDVSTESKITTTNYLKLFFNANHRIKFACRPRYERFKNVNHNNKKRALIPFTFGKDSLLSFGLAGELGIKPILVFFREPRSPWENRHKYKLAQRFLEGFNQELIFFPISAGWLRKVDSQGPWWGWDPLLTQYSLLLIPYLFAYRTKYLFWSNEQSCNFTFTDKEGYLINPVFEQNHQWLLSTNSSFKTLGCNSIFASLVEPLHEIAIMYILHHRYPKIARFQNSCFGDEEPAKTRRWCGVCSKCARMYIFMKALGINPQRVGFNQDMLREDKKHLYSLFGCQDGTYDSSGLGKDEQLLAFYLAYKKGVKGKLINEFVKTYLGQAQKRAKELYQTFFSLHSTQTLPYQLKKPLLKIFNQELKTFKKHYLSAKNFLVIDKKKI